MIGQLDRRHDEDSGWGPEQLETLGLGVTRLEGLPHQLLNRGFDQQVDMPQADDRDRNPIAKDHVSLAIDEHDAEWQRIEHRFEGDL